MIPRYVPLPRSVLDWGPTCRELFEERAGIREFEGYQSRKEAEQGAEDDVRGWHLEHWQELTDEGEKEGTNRKKSR